MFVCVWGGGGGAHAIDFKWLVGCGQELEIHMRYMTHGLEAMSLCSVSHLEVLLKAGVDRLD